MSRLPHDPSYEPPHGNFDARAPILLLDDVWVEELEEFHDAAHYW